MVAQAQGRVDALRGDIGQHSVQRHGIAMHVGNDGEAQF
jgi:hypothetical protein